MFIIESSLVTESVGGKHKKYATTYCPQYGIAFDESAIKKIFEKIGVKLDDPLYIDDSRHAHTKGYHDGGSITYATFTAVPVDVVYPDKECEIEDEIEFNDEYDEDLFE